MDEHTGKIFLTVAETAEIVRVDRRTVLNLIDRGELRGVRVGRMWRISVRDLAEYLGIEETAVTHRYRTIAAEAAA